MSKDIIAVPMSEDEARRLLQALTLADKKIIAQAKEQYQDPAIRIRVVDDEIKNLYDKLTKVIQIYEARRNAENLQAELNRQ